MNTAKFSRHPYRTRANSKTMEDWENAHEEVKEEISQVKGEISQMKDQMGQILEALRAMKSSGESSVINGGTSYPPGFHPHVSSGHTVYPPHHQVSQGTSSQAFPPYGLPPGYTSNGRVYRS